MNPIDIGVFAFTALAILILIGMHVSTALLTVAFFGTWYMRGDVDMAGTMLGLAATDAVAMYEFGVIPLFVLMGMVAMISGIGKDAYEAAHLKLRNVRGGLAYATVVANALFAAIIGVSIAAAVLFTKLAVPEMQQRGYPPRLAVGVVAASSLLGMLIPPSLLLVVYGIVTETSIGSLYQAALGPGFLLIIAYGVVIYMWARHSPGSHEAAAAKLDEASTRLTPDMLKRILPMPILIAVVLGGIYTGVFTATESAAVGAAGVFILALSRRTMSWGMFKKVLIETGNISASLILIIAAASMFSRFVAISGIPTSIGNWVVQAELGLMQILLVYVGILLLLGLVVDSTSAILITTPLFVMVFQSLGGDLVWIGLVTVLAVEIGMLTPPMGLAVFVVKASLADQRMPLRDVFMGAFPFVIAGLIVLALIISFPIFTKTWF